jgi:hypothetical protein
MFIIKKISPKSWSTASEKTIYLTNKNVTTLPTLGIANDWFLDKKTIKFPSEK